MSSHTERMNIYNQGGTITEMANKAKITRPAFKSWMKHNNLKAHPILSYSDKNKVYTKKLRKLEHYYFLADLYGYISGDKPEREKRIFSLMEAVRNDKL